VADGTGDGDKKKRKHGSEKRQRTKLTAHRWFKDEFREAAARADRAGLSFGAYIRAAALGNAGPRARRRAPADHVLLRQILGQLGKIGSNLNQIAHRLNLGNEPDLPGLKTALKDWRDIRAAILKALGKKEGPEP
jgi:hypothetical protein